MLSVHRYHTGDYSHEQNQPIAIICNSSSVGNRHTATLTDSYLAAYNAWPAALSLHVTSALGCTGCAPVGLPDKAEGQLVGYRIQTGVSW